MARARSPNSIEAEEMYKSGMKLVDIAKKLDVPASTVRRWKSTQNWDGDTKKKKSERSPKKKANARHKGGQLGNKNAVGNKGGPLKPGDKIAEKHGAYSSVYWDVLDESEKDMMPETYACAVVAATIGECGICGWIRTNKDKQQDRKWQKQDEKEGREQNDSDMNVGNINEEDNL